MNDAARWAEAKGEPDPWVTNDAILGTCACRTCECYVEAEDVCLGCEHGVHPGEVE